MRIYTVSVICCAVQFRIYFSDHISGLGNAFGRLCVYVCVADDNVSTVTETSLINPQNQRFKKKQVTVVFLELGQVRRSGS